MFYFSPLTSRANSFSVDSCACSRLPFRLCHSMHTLTPFQSHAHVFFGGGVLLILHLWCWMVAVESVESLLLFPFELVGVTGLTELHVNYVHVHGRRQAGSRTWALSHTPTQMRSHTSLADSWLQYSPSVFWFSLWRLWVTRLPSARLA